MTTILNKLENTTTIPTDAQVEALAHERYTNAALVSRVDGTYLRVILIASQAQLGKRSRVKANTEAQATVLAQVHERFYACVLRGVTTDDIAIEADLDPKESTRRSLERNRRSAFARSAKSTLLAYVNGGGDLRSLDATLATKAALRAAVEPPKPTGKIERQIANAKGLLLRAIGRQARTDPDKARETLEAAVEELQKLLDELPGAEVEAHEETTVSTRVTRAPQDRGPARTRVGVPMLNRGA